MESDHIEKWLHREIEEPAKRVIEKAVCRARITPGEWRDLIRFVAAQDVRTPAHFSRCLAGYSTIVPETIERSLRDLKEKLTRSPALSTQEEETAALAQTQGMPFPMRTTVVDDDNGMATVRVEVLGGRRLWLYEIQRVLGSTWETLAEHRWTILEAPVGIAWFTSDDPVMKLHTRNDGTYNFGGGWNSPRTEILMPLSPKHMLYTRMGSKPPERGHVLPRDIAMRFRRLLLKPG